MRLPNNARITGIALQDVTAFSLMEGVPAVKFSGHKRQSDALQTLRRKLHSDAERYCQAVV